MEHQERGMVTAEFAIVLPVVLAVLALVASLGSAMITHLNVADAAREAARAIAMEADESHVRHLVRDKVDGASISIDRSGDHVSVTVSADIGGVLTPLDLTASSTVTSLVEPR